MIRRCAVFDCNNTDKHNQSYRFPADKGQALKWKNSLKLKEFPVELLQSKFTVCSAHFVEDDYECSSIEFDGKNIQEQKILKAVAIPELLKKSTTLKVEVTDFSNASTTDTDNTIESCIEFMPPTKANLLKFLHPVPIMSHSYQSTASTNNTDICVLETHYDDDVNQCCCPPELEHSIDAPDFTVVHAPLPLQQRHTCSAFDESTEVLLLNSEYTGKSSSHAPSGTDSDVEVLMSEEIIDSDWSADAAAALEDLNQPQLSKNTKHVNDDSITSISVQRQASTDQDISAAEELSSNAELNRTELLNVIREQAARIQNLEATLQRYREAQHALFAQVDALRVEFAVSASISLEFDKSHETIN